MIRSFRLMRWATHGAVLLVIAAACASAPVVPLSPPKDLASFGPVVGEWKGVVTSALGQNTFWTHTFNARLTIAPDGSFTSSVEGRPGAGKGQIKDGKIVYEGSYSRGTVTLHERAGQPVLRGDGTLVGYDGWCSFELTRP